MSGSPPGGAARHFSGRALRRSSDPFASIHLYPDQAGTRDLLGGKPGGGTALLRGGAGRERHCSHRVWHRGRKAGRTARSRREAESGWRPAEFPMAGTSAGRQVFCAPRTPAVFAGLRVASCEKNRRNLSAPGVNSGYLSGARSGRAWISDPTVRFDRPVRAGRGRFRERLRHCTGPESGRKSADRSGAAVSIVFPMAGKRLLTATFCAQTSRRPKQMSPTTEALNAQTADHVIRCPCAVHS